MDFRVGRWLVQPGIGRISGEGHTCHVTPKSMDVLVFLAKRQGQIASKDEIFREVWPGTFVSDDALTRCIGELRRALHDNARNPSIIRTVAKRGYLTSAPVVWDPDSGADPALHESTPTSDASSAETLAPRPKLCIERLCGARGLSSQAHVLRRGLSCWCWEPAACSGNGVAARDDP